MAFGRGHNSKKIVTKIGSVIGQGVDKVLGTKIAAMQGSMTEGFNKSGRICSGMVLQEICSPTKFTKFLKSFKVGVDGKAVVNTNAFVKKLLSIRDSGKWVLHWDW